MYKIINNSGQTMNIDGNKVLNKKSVEVENADNYKSRHGFLVINIKSKMDVIKTNKYKKEVKKKYKKKDK